MPNFSVVHVRRILFTYNCVSVKLSSMAEVAILEARTKKGQNRRLKPRSIYIYQYARRVKCVLFNSRVSL